MPAEAAENDCDNSPLPSCQTSDFLLELKEKNSLIAFQALLDSIDLWVSCIKYYCDILNPASSRLSAQMMVDILNTPEGAGIFFAGAALFGAFAFIGNYSDAEDVKNSVVAGICDAYWPYVRDCIKGVKWTYKGMRSVFLVGQMMSSQLSIAMIVPLGVTFGAISAVNRFWNRSMVERRKCHQSVNDNFRKHIKAINACYIAVETQPSDWELQNIYQGCIIKLNNIYYLVENNEKAAKEEFSVELKEIKCVPTDVPEIKHVDKVVTGGDNNIVKKDGQYYEIIPASEEGQKPQLQLIYGITEDEIHKVLHCNQNLEEGERIDWFHFHTILDSQQVSHDSILRIALAQKKQFLQKVSYQKKLLDDPTGKYHQDMFAGLVALQTWPSVQDLQSVYQNCIVHLDTQDPEAGYYLIRLDEHSNQLIKEKLLGEDLGFLQNLNQPLPISIEDFTRILQNLPEEHHLRSIARKRQKVIERNYHYYQLIGRSEFQKDSFEAKCSAILSGVLNAPYYFLGLLSMVSLPYSAFLGAVLACSAFMLLNVVAEYYQECDYQRRLKISQLKANMSMLKRLVSSEWDLINDLLKKSASPGVNAKQQFVSYLQAVLQSDLSDEDKELLCGFLEHEGFDVSNLNSGTAQILNDDKMAMIQYLRNVVDYQHKFSKEKAALKAELILSDDFILMQGIRNGLYCYGIANGFLMTLAIMSFFGVFAFTPTMFWASVGFGFFCVAAGLLYTWWNAKEFSQVNSSNSEEHHLESDQHNSMITHEDLREWGTTYYFDSCSRDQIQTVDDIKQTQNLMISDQCEVLRQAISGNKKGYKLLQTLSIFLPTLAANSQSLTTQITYLSVGIIYAGFFSLKGLRNLVRVDNQEYEKSTTWKMLTFWDTPQKPDTAFDKNRNNSVNTFMPLSRGASPYPSDS